MSTIEEIKQQLLQLPQQQLLALEKEMKPTSGRGRNTKEAIISRMVTHLKKQNPTSVVQQVTIPAPIEKPSVAARLPKVWKYDEEKVNPAQFIKKKKTAQSGDIIIPEDGAERGNGVYIVGENNKMVSPIGFMNGEIMLPPWVLQKGLDRGFTLEQLLPIYKEVISGVIVYPYAYQGDSLKYNKQNGVISALRVYSDMGPPPDGNFVLNKDHYYYKDLSDKTDLNMKYLFPHVPRN